MLSIYYFYSLSILFRPPPDVRLGGGRGYLLTPLPSLPFPMLCIHTGSFAHPGVMCIYPSTPRPVATSIITRYLPASPALAVPVIFLTLRPYRRQNLFLRCNQLLLSHHFSPSWLTAPPPYLVARLHVSNHNYYPKLHSLRHCFLLLVNVRLQCLCSRFHLYPCR